MSAQVQTSIILVIVLFITSLNSLPTTKKGQSNSSAWFSNAQNELKSMLKSDLPSKQKAKNVIMFLGDGMSIATVTAARMHQGQRGGMAGEEASLILDKFPNIGLSKTYCLDRQVSDSACTATAYLGGVKANYKTIGVTGAVKLMDCDASLNPKNHVYSIAEFAQEAGMDTGIVTTTRVTHASPAGTYGHVSSRYWESDFDVVDYGFDPNKCPDLATQLVEGKVGKNFKVILGGGRKKFIPKTALDDDGLKGQRLDGQDLTAKWKNTKLAEGKKAAYVTNKDELFKASKMADYILGLFHSNHMLYHLLSDEKKHPKLSEMTSVAIDILTKENKGFFLFVEGGKIDIAHHDNMANIALDETIEFAEAIEVALEKTGDDTLIVVTSDHGHTMSISGHPKRGADILTNKNKGKDNMWYHTVTYSNGPSYKGLVNGSRFDMSSNDISDPEYKFPGSFPLTDETHSGEEVLVFAHGPWSNLFTGIYEQNYIPHAMAFSACIGPGITACSKEM